MRSDTDTYVVSSVFQQATTCIVFSGDDLNRLSPILHLMELMIMRFTVCVHKRFTCTVFHGADDRGVGSVRRQPVTCIVFSEADDSEIAVCVNSRSPVLCSVEMVTSRVQ